MQGMVADNGFHQDEDGMWWLIQGGSVQSAVNLPAEACPFSIAPGRNRSATDLKLVPRMEHNAPLADVMAQDPVAKYFLPSVDPLPPLFVRASALNLSSVTKHVLALTGLQGAIVTTCFTEWMGNNIPTRVAKLNSNFVTAVLYGGYTPAGDTVRHLLEHANFARRRLVIVGAQEPDDFHRDMYDVFDATENNWNTDYTKVPHNVEVLRHVGGHLAYKFMRGEL